MTTILSYSVTIDVNTELKMIKFILCYIKFELTVVTMQLKRLTEVAATINKDFQQITYNNSWFTFDISN